MRSASTGALVVALAVGVACSHKPLPEGVLAEDARLVGVSEAQDFVLYTNSDDDLRAILLPSGEGRTLISSFHGHVSLSGSTVFGDAAGFGFGSVWTPRMQSSWQLPYENTNWTLTPDGQTLAYFHETDRTGLGNVEVVRVNECGASSCKEQIALAGVQRSISSLSQDGRFLAVHGATGMTLIDLATLDATRLPLPAGYALGSPWPAFSRDGSLVAMTPYTREPSPSALVQVFATATATPLDWHASLPGTPWGEPHFLADDSLFVGMASFDQMSWSSYRVTSTAATEVASGMYYKPDAYVLGDHYLIAHLSTANWLVTDLRYPDQPPVTVSFPASHSFAAFNDDYSRMIYLENLDRNRSTGDVVLATFPGGERLASFAKVWTVILDSTVQFGGDGSALLYLPGGDPRIEGSSLHLWRDGVDRIIDDRVTGFVTRQNPDTVYYEAKSPDGRSSIHQARLQ